MIGYEHIEVLREDRLTTIRLNRPAVLNALHRSAHDECVAAFDAFAADREQWVAILTGAGERAFSAGHDLKSHAAGDVTTLPAAGFAGLTGRFDLAKPIIAAVNGLALGGGFEAALACDIIIAAENASFGLPEPRVGLAALAGGLHRLPRAIGIKRAMEMALTCRRVSAQEGRDLGFVNHIVPTGQALEAARALAQEIIAASPLAIRATKQVMMHGFDKTLPDALALQWDDPDLKASRASDDAREGPAAFADKRRPAWKGR